MKDYSLNSKHSKKYILSYKIIDDKIVIKLANRELYTIPYSEENENKILYKMEDQARCATLKPFKKMDKFLAIFNPLTLPLAIMNFINNGGWFYGILLAIIIEGTLHYTTKAIIRAIMKIDIIKLNYFLEHKKELNENIEKSENIKLGISKKAIKQIELQKSENKEPFNINNIDNYSYFDLKKIKENIERIQTFGFNEEEPVLKNTVEEKSPVLKKTLNKKKK